MQLAAGLEPAQAFAPLASAAEVYLSVTDETSLLGADRRRPPFIVNANRLPANASRLGLVSAWTISLVGAAYVAVILVWLIRVRSPGEPIADPYLGAMEILTIASGLAILGLVVALSVLLSGLRPVHARIVLVSGSLAAALTMTVHFVQLTAVRQLWRAGRLPDYRLVWPSPLFAVEYFAWDILVGLTMLSAGLALSGFQTATRARWALLLGGTLCVLGVAGPASGRMGLQNVAVLGYAVMLPIAALFMTRFFGDVSTHRDAA